MKIVNFSHFHNQEIFLLLMIFTVFTNDYSNEQSNHEEAVKKNYFYISEKTFFNAEILKNLNSVCVEDIMQSLIFFPVIFFDASEKRRTHRNVYLSIIYGIN